MLIGKVQILLSSKC